MHLTMPSLDINHLFALNGFEVPHKRNPDLDVGPTTNTRTKYRAQYIMSWPDDKPHYMASSFDPSPWALRLEKAGIKITWLDGYRGKPIDELALSTPDVPLDVVGSPCSAPGATSNLLLSTRLSPHHCQSCPQHDHPWNQQGHPWNQQDHPWNQQDHPLQPHQGPTTMLVGASASLDHDSYPTHITTEKTAKRGAGRPPGSKNKPKSANPEAPKEKRKPGRPPGSKNKAKVTVAYGSQEFSPNLQYQNKGITKKDNIGQERREHKIAIRHNSGANLFSQNQHLAHQHVQTQQPLSAGQTPLGFSHPTTVAQNDYFGQKRYHHALPTCNVDQADGAGIEHLSLWLSQQRNTSQPLSTNTVAGYTNPTTLGPNIEYIRKQNDARLSRYILDQASQAWNHHQPSSQDHDVHTQQPLSTDTSPPTAHTYSTTMAQNDYVGQDENHDALPSDNANQTNQAYDVRSPSSQDQQIHTQHLFSDESLSENTLLTTMNQQDEFGLDEDLSISPGPILDEDYQAIDESSASFQGQQLPNAWHWKNILTTEEKAGTSQPYPSPSTTEADARSQSATASTDCLVDPALLGAQVVEIERADG